MADGDTLVRLGIGFDISSQEVSNLQRRISDIERGIPAINLKFGGSFAGINNDVSQFTSYMDRANQRVIAFTSSVSVLYSTIKIFKDIVSETIEVNKALTDINSVMKLSAGSLDTFAKNLFDAARATSSSFEDAAEAAKTFSRQGLSVAETLKRTTDALTLSRVAGIDAAEAVKELTIAVNIFEKSGTNTRDIVQALAAVSSNFAVSTKDLTDGFTRVGATAATAGISFNQLVGLIAAAKEHTQRDGAAIGTALNSIFTKFEPKAAVEGLERLGVAVKDSAGNALPAISILQNLAKQYDALGESSKAQIDKFIGGARQINILKGALGDLANANGTYAQTQKLLSGNLDDVTARLNAQNQSLTALLQNFSTTSKQINANIGNLTVAPVLRTLVGGATDNPVVAALKDASGQAQTLGGKFAEDFISGLGNSLLLGAGPLIIAAASRIIGRTLLTAGKDIANQAQLAGFGQQQITAQDQIVKLYNQGDEALKRQLATMTQLIGASQGLASALATGSGSGRKGGSSPLSVFFPNGNSLSPSELSVTEETVRNNLLVTEIANSSKAVRGLGLSPQELLSGSSGTLSDAARNSLLAKQISGSSSLRGLGLSSNVLGNADIGDIQETLIRQTASQQLGSLKGANLGVLDRFVEDNRKSLTASVAPQIAAITNLRQGVSNGINPILQEIGGLRGNVDSGTADQMSAIEAQNNSIIRQRQQAYLSSLIVPITQQRGRGLTGIFGSQKNDLLAIQSGLGIDLAGKSEFAEDARNVSSLPLAALQQVRGQNLLNFGLGASFALPFAGGAVSQLGNQLGATGGTRLGIGFGTASGVLSGAGLGAGIGGFAGPEGVLAGLAIGGIVGGLKGAFSKITQSFEELADEITKRNEKINSDYQKAADVFRLQGELADALKSGADPKKIKELQQEEFSALGGIQNDRIKQLIIGGINNPGATQATLSSLQHTDLVNSNTVAGFQVAGNSVIGNATNPFSLGNNTTSISQVAAAVSSILPLLNPVQLKSFQTLIANNDGQQAFNALAKIGGLNQEQIGNLQPGLFTSSAVSNRLFSLGIGKALGGNGVDQNLIGPSQQAAESGADLSKKIQALAQSFQLAAKTTEILGIAYTKISEAIQKALLATTLQTEVDKISQQGTFDQSNIRNIFNTQRGQTALGGAAGLLNLLDKSGIKDNQLTAGVSTARTLDDFINLEKSAKIFEQGAAEEYKKLLQDTVNKLQEINLSEQTSLAVAKATNELLIIQEKSKERDTLEANAKFDPATFAQLQFQSNLGNTSATGRANQATGIQSLLGEQSTLTSLGIPQTNDSLDYISGLQETRTRSTLAQILTNRLGKNVGSSTQSLQAAAQQLQNNPQNTGDFELGSRISSAVDLNVFDPASAINKVKASVGDNPEEFAKILGQASGLGATDTFTAKIANAISGADGTNALLKDIRAAIVSAKIAQDQGKKYDDLYSASQGLGAAKLAGNPDQISAAQKIYDAALANSKTPSIVDPNSIKLPSLQYTTTGGANSATGAAGQSPDVLAAVGVDGTSKRSFGSSLSSSFAGFGSGFQLGASDPVTQLTAMSNVGIEVAQGIQSSFDKMWDSFITGTTRGHNAFRQFLAGITGDASKAFSNNAFKQIFSMATTAIGNLFGSSSNSNLGSVSGNAQGGIIGLAGGGSVPAMLTGGEFYISPASARNIGYNRLQSMNRGYAGGGMVNGGSGLKDDVPANLPPGSFIMKKAAVHRWGPSNLQNMANAAQRSRGGPIYMDDGGDVGTGELTAGDYSSYGANSDASSGTTLSMGNNNLASAGTSSLAALILLLVEGLFNQKHGLLDTAQTTSNANLIRNVQQGYFSNPASVPSNSNLGGQSSGGQFAYMVADGNGGYRVVNYGGPAASVTNYSNNANGGAIVSMQGYDSGGGVGPSASGGGGVGGGVGSVNVTVHNYGNGNTSSNTQTQGGGADFKSKDFATKLGSQVEAKVKEVLSNEMRSGGLFTQQKRYFPSSG